MAQTMKEWGDEHGYTHDCIHCGQISDCLNCGCTPEEPEEDDYDEQEALEDAYGELGAAVVQMIPKDDQMICDHVRKAHAILKHLLERRR